jgi:hypothetical protein
MPTKKKSAIAHRIKYDSKYVRTRENMAEFARGGKAAKLIRSTFRELLINAPDKTISNRLVHTCMEILASDPHSGRGERTVGKGNLDRLRKFNFNSHLNFETTLFARPAYTFDRTTGLLTVSIPPFRPKGMIEASRSSTHYAVTAAAVAVDFDNERYDHAIETSAELSRMDEQVPALELKLQLPANSPYPVLLTMGIEFLQRLTERRYVLSGQEFNASTIVEVFKP